MTICHMIASSNNYIPMQNQPPALKRPKPVSFTPRSSVPNPIPHSLTLPKKRPSMIFKKVRKVKEKSPPMDNGYNGGQFEEREHTTNTWGEDDIEQDFNDVCMYVYTCMYVHVCVYTIYMYVTMYVHVHICVYTCMYVCKNFTYRNSGKFRTIKIFV